MKKKYLTSLLILLLCGFVVTAFIAGCTTGGSNDYPVPSPAPTTSPTTSPTASPTPSPSPSPSPTAIEGYSFIVKNPNNVSAGLVNGSQPIPTGAHTVKDPDNTDHTLESTTAPRTITNYSYGSTPTTVVGSVNAPFDPDPTQAPYSYTFTPTTANGDYVFNIIDGRSTVTVPNNTTPGQVTNTMTRVLTVDQWIFDDGVPNTWEDISTSGTVVTGVQDDTSHLAPIGFDFVFFGTTYNQLYICSNGYVSFADTAGDIIEPTFGGMAQTNSPDNVICPWGIDWYPPYGGEIRYETLGTAPNRRFVVSWLDVFNIYEGTDPDNTGATWQVILYEGTNQIKFNYLDTNMDGNNVSQFNDGAYPFGPPDFAEVGIRGNGAGTTVYYTPKAAPYLTPTKGVQWTTYTGNEPINVSWNNVGANYGYLVTAYNNDDGGNFEILWSSNDFESIDFSDPASIQTFINGLTTGTTAQAPGGVFSSLTTGDQVFIEVTAFDKDSFNSNETFPFGFWTLNGSTDTQFGEPLFPN